MQLRDWREKCFGVELSLKGLEWLTARDPCVCLFHPLALQCHDFSPRPQYMTCGLLGPLILSVTLLLATSFPGEEEGNSRPRCGPDEFFWKWQQPALSSSLPENTQRFPLPHLGGSNHVGTGLKPLGKLVARTPGKAHSAQPFVLRVLKFFHEGKKEKSHINDGIVSVCPADSVWTRCSSSPKPIAGVIEEESCCSIWTTLNHWEEPRCVCPQGLVTSITDNSLRSRGNHPMQIPVLLYPLVFYSSSHTPIAWSVNILSSSFCICLDIIPCLSLSHWLIVWLSKHFQSMLVCGERHQQW